MTDMSRFDSPKKHVLWPLFLCLFYLSCTEQNPELSGEEKYVVDTLYSKRVAFFRAEADSLCKIYHEIHYKRIRDSIQNETLAEIELLLNKKITSE